MKRIEYRATYNVKDRAYGSHTDVIAVFAQSINSGFAKAVRLATKGLPKNWELHSVEFWQVTS